MDYDTHFERIGRGIVIAVAVLLTAAAAQFLRWLYIGAPGEEETGSAPLFTFPEAIVAGIILFAVLYTVGCILPIFEEKIDKWTN